MSESIDWFNKNILYHPAFSGLATGIFLAVCAVLWKPFWIWRHRKRIYNFLKESEAGTNFTFRSGEKIQRKTGIDLDRVRWICDNHPKIVRNTAEKDSWRIKRGDE